MVTERPAAARVEAAARVIADHRAFTRRVLNGWCWFCACGATADGYSDEHIARWHHEKHLAAAILGVSSRQTPADGKREAQARSEGRLDVMGIILDAAFVDEVGRRVANIDLIRDEVSRLDGETSLAEQYRVAATDDEPPHECSGDCECDNICRHRPADVGAGDGAEEQT